jgi:DNA-binding NarL/FixJ family response regulator
MSIDTSNAIESGGPAVRTAVRTVAQVDVRVPLQGAALSDAAAAANAAQRDVFDAALLTIERTVRPDDRVCPFGLSHIAVAFGPDADAVHPRTLGERLARAVGQGLLTESAARVGRDPGRGVRTGAPTASVGTLPSTTVVTVDRVVEDMTVGGSVTERISGPLVWATRPTSPQTTARHLHHRTIVRYSTARLAGYGTRHDDRPPAAERGDRLGTVLVIDPDPRAGATPGLTAQAAGALARRLGFRTGVVALSHGDQLIAEIEGNPVDLVVLVVGAEPAGACSWSTSTWRVPAQLSALYRSRGSEVLAVSSGATAGALVGCIEQGASVLFDLNTLSSHLLGSTLGDGPGPRRPDQDHQRLPAPLPALLRLTSSERRVLFYLTTGMAAQDIADDLVVSLATVRSHIRSILRKLNVRSQLAAVAVANSCGSFHDETSHAS